MCLIFAFLIKRRNIRKRNSLRKKRSSSPLFTTERNDLSLESDVILDKKLVVHKNYKYSMHSSIHINYSQSMRRDKRFNSPPPRPRHFRIKKIPDIPYIRRAGEVNDGSDIYVTIYGVSHYRHSSHKSEAWRLVP